MHSGSRTTSPTQPTRTRVTAPARAGTVLAVLSAVLVILVAGSWSPLMSFDGTVAEELHRWAVDDPGLTQVSRVLTDWVWDPWTMRALTAVIFGWLWWLRERLLGLWIAVTSTVSTFVQQGLKSTVGRERPQWPDPVDSAHYMAFPSGHAMTATVTCGLLLWLLGRRMPGGGGDTGGARGWLWRLAVVGAVVSVVGVGLTRVYLGVHWPSDVVGGWLLGACFVALSIASYERVVLSRAR